MRLVWSVFALSDRDGIFTHIEADNPAVAIAIDERIVTGPAASPTFPRAVDQGALPERASLS